MTTPTTSSSVGTFKLEDEQPLPSLLEWRVDKPSPHLLAIRQRDGRSRYEETFGHPPPDEVLNALDGWSQVAWMERAIFEIHPPKWLGTFTPPAPYRVFRLIAKQDALA